MLTLIGLAIIITIVTLLLFEKVIPIIALSAIPFIGALLAGFGINEISEFFQQGVNKVAGVAFMFMFAILFFSIMKERGLFDPLITGMVKLTRGNVVAVAVMTALVSACVHLDGAGAATFLIVMPALIPLYRRLGMSPYLMLTLMATSMGLLNMVPWGGPIGRAAAVTDISPDELWHGLIPVQLVGVVLAVIGAALLGWREKRRIERLGGMEAAIAHNYPPGSSMDVASSGTATDAVADDAESEGEASGVAQGMPRFYWINAALTLVTVVSLALGLMAPAYIFMIALSVALLLNYPSLSEQSRVITQYAPQAFNMGAIIAAAGAFLGILNGTGMLEAIALDVTRILPGQAVGLLHILVGIMGVPLELLTSTDAYYFALLPVIQQITASAGVDPIAVAHAMSIGSIVGTFISPFSPALWLALGLAGLEMGRYIRYAFLYLWGFSLIMMMFGALFGLY
ncbi:citrate-Mg2+:H+ or citrate-Ca2+:H+ symporter, CitMHS family [Kushneria avicenniae]|uniref:Citrate-Mg2+:H+ or citrate-Ca2+:H+ symporter, CitMHS family n=1 Tax=Kushneria avicenniae TaxID=402385 RepID=A0A1I1HZR4_9GAMM|nr:citrate:proton symporter [Kushneria avicenniae]SFC29659.1 citrate-Mg2+:H+ or citrate-Ca2+:H+ symporter, CitMHS family [Kushneria avicenniae]